MPNPVSFEIYHSLPNKHKVSLAQTGNYPRARSQTGGAAQLQFARVESMTYSCASSAKPGMPGFEW